jgi:hypothetical protein
MILAHEAKKQLDEEINMVNDKLFTMGQVESFTMRIAWIFLRCHEVQICNMTDESIKRFAEYVFLQVVKVFNEWSELCNSDKEFNFEKEYSDFEDKLIEKTIEQVKKEINPEKLKVNPELASYLEGKKNAV